MNIKAKIRDIIKTKQSNLCVSLDYNKSSQILETLNSIKNKIVMVKIHCDIIEDFNKEFVNKLVLLCEENDILIFEDRKFADIGAIFKQQFTNGIFKINSWCNLITMHSLVGDGIIKEFNKYKTSNQGALLIANMSNSNNLFDAKYEENTIKLADENSDDIVGFICQRKISNDNYLYLIPGVNRHITKDSSDQHYISPETAIKNGADIIIVGRGITSSKDILQECIAYQTICWNLYNNK